MKVLDQIDVCHFGAYGDDDDGDAAVAEAEMSNATAEARLMMGSSIPMQDEKATETDFFDYFTEEKPDKTVSDFLKAEPRTPDPSISQYPIDRAMSEYRVLSADEERVILESLPHDIAVTSIVLHSLRFASYVASKFYRNSPVAFEDRRQVAVMALIKAAAVFGDDPKNYTLPNGSRKRFISFAYGYIRLMLSRCCNPKWGCRDAKTALRSELASTIFSEDITRTFDVLNGEALTVGKAEEDGEYTNGIVRSIETLLDKDNLHTFSKDESAMLMFILKQRLSGLSNHDIAPKIGMSVTNIGFKMNRLKIFLLRQSLARVPLMKDLEWLLRESYWMRAGKALANRISDFSTAVQERALARDIKKKVEAQPYQEPIPHNSRKNYEKYNRARVKTHSYFIPWKLYNGPLKPRTSCPASGNFYTTEAYQRFSLCP